MSSIIPKITTEDVRNTLNGSCTGSTYYFWSKPINSGSLLAQINLANYDLYNMLGSSVMDSTDEVISSSVKSIELDMSCVRLLTVLSGNLITDGYSFKAGVEYNANRIVEGYGNLIKLYTDQALNKLKTLQSIAVIGETEEPVYDSPSPGYM